MMSRRAENVDTRIIELRAGLCENSLVTRRAGAMHVETSRSHQVRKDGTVAELRAAPAAPLVPGRRQGPQGDPGEPVAAAAGGDHRGPGGAGRQDAGRCRRRIRGHPVAAARARRRGGGDGPRAGLPGPARPARPGAGPGLALMHVAGTAPGFQAVHAGWWDDVTLGPDLGVAGAATDDIYAAMDWLERARTTSRSSSPPGTWSRAGSPCSTCRRPGWKARIASWPPTATPGTASAEGADRVRAADRQATGGRWRCGCSPATPPTRKRSRGG